MVDIIDSLQRGQINKVGIHRLYYRHVTGRPEQEGRYRPYYRHVTTRSDQKVGGLYIRHVTKKDHSNKVGGF